jgi:hypothetical protein
MTARSFILALVLLGSGIAAANAAGDNVVLVTVGTVQVPAKLPGVCALSGIVRQVLDGKAFHAGQVISLSIPCRGDEASLIPAVATNAPAGPRFISADILAKSKRGLARLDDSGALIWDYSKRSYGHLGVAGGYRVMDGATMPVMPAR